MERIPDIENTKPRIESVIQRVGVSSVELPFYLILRDGGSGPTQIIAKAEMTCKLGPDLRGISMSRFLRVLQPYLREPLRRITIEEILKSFLNTHDTDVASLKFEFKLPIMVKSPLTDNEFPHYYNCGFRCDYNKKVAQKFIFYQKVRVQYAAYCPCSAALCHYGKHGYPHSQRAFADVIVRSSPHAYLWLENIVDIVEDSVKTIPYPIIKRSDEKWIAGMAKSYPLFVEDAIRNISSVLDRHNDIIDWFVRCTHEESIHTSNAIAINWKIDGHFNENTYI